MLFSSSLSMLAKDFRKLRSPLIMSLSTFTLVLAKLEHQFSLKDEEWKPFVGLAHSSFPVVTKRPLQ